MGAVERLGAGVRLVGNKYLTYGAHERCGDQESDGKSHGGTGSIRK